MSFSSAGNKGLKAPMEVEEKKREGLRTRTDGDRRMSIGHECVRIIFITLAGFGRTPRHLATAQ